jgi:hypothetical protein
VPQPAKSVQSRVDTHLMVASVVNIGTDVGHATIKTYFCGGYKKSRQSANQYKGMILDLVHWFLCTNISV